MHRETAAGFFSLWPGRCSAFREEGAVVLIIAAICHAPWVLLEAGLVRGRKVASWPSLRTDLVNAGAEWVDQEVVVDGNLITSRKPDDIPAYNEACVIRFGLALMPIPS
jgi:putative intracellular protease/amidase